MKKLGFLIVSMLFAFQAQAASSGASSGQFYLGGGVSSNDIDHDFADDDATGFQIFGGMPIPLKLGKAKLLGEVGYMDSGEFDRSDRFGTFVVKDEAKGIWANAVVEFPVARKVNLLGRLGLDFGDDDGLMIGGGVGFVAGSRLDLRIEYVIRDNIDSLQFNVAVGL